MEFEFIEVMEKLGLRAFPVNGHLHLKYGTMSIQANEFCYCTPKTYYSNLKRYEAFEIGVICDSEKVDKILKPYHFDDLGEMKLYEQVPKGLVEQVYQLLK